MRTRLAVITFSVFILANVTLALEPEEILVIANGDIKDSVKLAKYYCSRRKVPEENIVILRLGSELKDTIGRSEYNEKIAGPVRKKLNSPELFGKIKCLLTTYGVPFKAEGRGQLEKQKEKLEKLKKLIEEGQDELSKLPEQVKPGSRNLDKEKKKIEYKLSKLKSTVALINGKETHASVDSELSMVLFDKYELYRWQMNELRNRWPYMYYNTLMVSRLDGPGVKIARGLVDKSIKAEKKGLRGIAYIDSGHSLKNKDKALFAEFDKSLQQLADVIRTEHLIPVVEENTEKLFDVNQCPSAFLYCGWYSLKNYIDAFDFIDGAIGYHIASWEAVDLRDPNSNQWCPAMLRDGVTATLGAVSEPYLHAFPKPKDFFVELLNGCCLVEAYYRSKPFNSWQLVLIGDPLYNPFKIKSGEKCLPTNVGESGQLEN